MAYLDDRINTLRKAKVGDYSYEKKPVIEPLWDFCNFVRENVPINGHSEFAPFVYYEKMAGYNRILGFRCPETDSYLIYRCMVDKSGKDPKFLVSVMGIKGEESMAYFQATARSIIPFFKAAEECFSDDMMKSTSISTINMRNGMCRRKDCQVELNETEILERSTKSIRK